MNKRGQVTSFIVLGLVLVIIAFLVFYFLGDRLTKKSEEEVIFHESELEPLKNYVEECIKLHGDEGLLIVGKQGGDINPGLYTSYMFPFDTEMSRLSYLCYTENFTSCINKRPLLAKHIESELNFFMLERLRTCIDLDQIREEGYKIEEGDMSINTNIGERVVIINVNYPLTISKGNNVIKEERFSQTFNVPLGVLIETANDIVDDEITLGEFFTVPYMMSKHGRIEVEKHRPGDSKVYKIKTYDSNYIFQFAVKNYVY
ncbi:MAG: hypothetical protein V1663_04570 [archaeon]